MERLEQIRLRVELWVDGDALEAEGEMTDDDLDFLIANKQEIINQLILEESLLVNFSDDWDLTSEPDYLEDQCEFELTEAEYETDLSEISPSNVLPSSSDVGTDVGEVHFTGHSSSSEYVRSIVEGHPQMLYRWAEKLDFPKFTINEFRLKNDWTWFEFLTKAQDSELCRACSQLADFEARNKPNF
jgi:hypothetical protein